MADKPTVAVLGAGGTMGFPIARNLARTGFEVRAWNRSRDKAAPLEKDGARVLDTPADAAAGAAAVITMLADTGSVLRCARDAFTPEENRSGVWLQMSTIGEAGIESCVELAGELGVELVDAPVLGTRQPAEEGKLVVIAAGPAGVLDRMQPVFDAIGHRTMWVGEAGAASRLKVATNSWILAVVEGAAETLALAEGMGVEPRLVLEAVSGGPLDLPYLQMKGKAMLERKFEPSFKLALAAKDASLVTESAQRHGLDLPLPATIRARMAKGAELHGDRDMSATYLTSAPGDGAGPATP